MTEAIAHDQTLAAAEVTGVSSGGKEAGATLERGAMVGRYVVVGRLGAGGMGVVYAAYDPELDRRVAIKLLQASGHDATDGRARLLREAQALAKLSHPNIVAVHDVGTVGDRVWIAMELVAGCTMRQWLDVGGRRWQEVLEVICDAGRGLAAAHAAGLVHRDVKPDNIMIGDDGRVRVMDFGLARADAGGPDLAAASTDRRAGPSVLRLELTTAGTVMGTPAYMSPEQHLGVAIDARTDQFALCVSAWEAVYGERPFRGESVMELATSVLEGRVTDGPALTKAPKWLRGVLRRGLSANPDVRWASLAAMLDALARGRARARKRQVLAALAVVGVAAAGVIGARELESRGRVRACELAGASIAEVWNDDARGRVRAAIVATGVGHAETTAKKVMPWIDAQASAWQSARTESCLDADVRDAWTPELLDRSLWCLDERRMELEALVDELSHADAAAVQQAVNAAARLAEVDGCRDASLLQRRPAPPTERGDDVRALRAELSRANALARTGGFDEGLALARSVRERALELAWPPLSASARLIEANILERQGAYVDAERAGIDSYFEASHAGAWDVAAGAAQRLILLTGGRQARAVDAHLWSRHAQLATAQAGDPEGLREAARLDSEGSSHFSAGDYAEAIALHERALPIWEAALGPDHPEVAVCLASLGNAWAVSGDYESARPLFERALAIFEKTLGPQHPDVATCLGALGNMEPDPVRARELYERALAILEQAVGTEHPDYAAALDNLAHAHQAVGDFAQAFPMRERALAVLEKTLGPDHPAVAMSFGNLAAMHVATGAGDEAVPLFERALVIFDKTVGPEHADTGIILTSLGELLVDRGEHAEALPLLERAARIYDALGDAHPNQAGVRFALARALVATKGDLERARILAEQACDAWRAGGEEPAKELAGAERWLAEHS